MATTHKSDWCTRGGKLKPPIPAKWDQIAKTERIYRPKDVLNSPIAAGWVKANYTHHYVPTEVLEILNLPLDRL